MTSEESCLLQYVDNLKLSMLSHRSNASKTETLFKAWRTDDIGPVSKYTSPSESKSRVLKPAMILHYSNRKQSSCPKGWGKESLTWVLSINAVSDPNA